MVNMMSFSTRPGVSVDGEGDKTTLGILWCLPCPPPALGRVLGSSEPDPKGLELDESEVDMAAREVDEGEGSVVVDDGTAAVGSQ